LEEIFDKQIATGKNSYSMASSTATSTEKLIVVEEDEDEDLSLMIPCHHHHHNHPSTPVQRSSSYSLTSNYSTLSMASHDSVDDSDGEYGYSQLIAPVETQFSQPKSKQSQKRAQSELINALLNYLTEKKSKSTGSMDKPESLLQMALKTVNNDEYSGDRFGIREKYVIKKYISQFKDHSLGSFSREERRLYFDEIFQNDL